MNKFDQPKAVTGAALVAVESSSTVFVIESESVFSAAGWAGSMGPGQVSLVHSK
jgi:hypothetical protein